MSSTEVTFKQGEDCCGCNCTDGEWNDQRTGNGCADGVAAKVASNILGFGFHVRCVDANLLYLLDSTQIICLLEPLITSWNSSRYFCGKFNLAPSVCSIHCLTYFAFFPHHMYVPWPHSPKEPLGTGGCCFTFWCPCFAYCTASENAKVDDLGIMYAVLGFIPVGNLISATILSMHVEEKRGLKKHGCVWVSTIQFSCSRFRLFLL